MQNPVYDQMRDMVSEGLFLLQRLPGNDAVSHDNIAQGAGFALRHRCCGRNRKGQDIGGARLAAPLTVDLGNPRIRRLFNGSMATLLVLSLVPCRAEGFTDEAWSSLFLTTLLAEQVREGRISDAEARKIMADAYTQTVTAYQNRRAAAAASGPVNCFWVGRVWTCD